MSEIWHNPGALDPKVRPRRNGDPVPAPPPLPHASWVESYRPPRRQTIKEIAAEAKRERRRAARGVEVVGEGAAK